MICENAEVEGLIKAYQEDSTIRNCQLSTKIDEEGMVVVSGKTRNFHQKQIAIHLFKKFILNNKIQGKLDVIVD